MFDLGGIAAKRAGLRFPAIEKYAPAVPVVHRPTRDRVLGVLSRYTPERQDFMVEPDPGTSVWMQTEDVLSDWRTNVAQQPVAYFKRRLDSLSWTMG